VAGDGRVFAYILDHIARPPGSAMSAHRTYLRALGSRGILVAGGPFRGGGGAVVCVLADDESEADAIARADPLVVFGFTVYQLREIDPIERAAHAPP
jgi:uncharacterized protein YciI